MEDYYGKWVLREGMKFYLKGNSKDYGIKGDSFQINSDAIITYAPDPQNKRKQIAVMLREKNGECFNKEVYMNKRKIKWNPENIKVVWNFDDLTSFRELYDMLKIFTFEYILTIWNETEKFLGKEELFDVERIYDICYVDTDFEEFLDMLEEKGISIDINYGVCENKEGYIRFSDSDGTTFEVKTSEELNRFDNELPTETIIFWNSTKEFVREKEKRFNLNNIINEAMKNKEVGLEQEKGNSKELDGIDSKDLER